MIDLSPRRAVLGPLLGLALMGLAVGPALAQAADGHHGPLARHAKKKKGKKKGGTQVIVHCASVGVSCKGTPGPAGPQGPTGPAGPQGPAGANGATVVLRARGSGTTQVTAESGSCGEIICGGSIPVSPDIWTEGPEEDNQFIGTVTLAIPSAAACGYEVSKKLEDDRVALVAEVDGKLEGITEAVGSTSATTVTASVVFDLGIEEEEAAAAGFGTGFLISNGTSQPHLLTVEGEDECQSTTHATVSNLAIDVLGTS